MKNKIISATLIHVGNGYNKEYGASYYRYRVMVTDVDGSIDALEQRFTDEELKELPYWVKRSQVMSMTCWGTSQEFETKIKLGAFLGINDRKDWPKFCRKVDELIKVI